MPPLHYTNPIPEPPPSDNPLPALRPLRSRDSSKRTNKHSSGLSLDSSAGLRSARSHPSHQEYIDSLPVPSMDQVKEIEAVQIKKEQDQIRKSLTLEHPELSEMEERKAAELIQRNYRGYRERRQMKGMDMDASTRWLEALKEARYRHLTTPRARRSQDAFSAESRQITEDSGMADGMPEAAAKRLPSVARHRWKTIGTIAKRAANDEDSSIASDSGDEELNEEKREQRRIILMIPLYHQDNQ